MPTPQKTRGIGIRLSQTHYYLLQSPKYKGKGSALVRVLLALFFNGKIPDVNALFEEEVLRAEKAETEQRFGKRILP